MVVNPRQHRPKVKEWHTTDLSSRCMKRVELRAMGRVLPEVTGAMFRGSLAHAYTEAWHKQTTVDLDAFVHEQTVTKGRVLSQATLRDLDKIDAECREMRDLYVDRFAEYFAACKVIGVEVPIRWTVDVDGRPAEFASHMDILYRTPEGLLAVDDWKTGDKDWDTEFVQRSIQLGMYFLAVQYGAVLLGDQWVEMSEAPLVRMIDLDALWPYSKTTEAVDDNGEKRTFKKGDVRPMSRIAHPLLVNNEAAVLDQFKTMVRMDRHGLYPMNPTDTGCRVCECRAACPKWSDAE